MVANDQVLQLFLAQLAPDVTMNCVLDTWCFMQVSIFIGMVSFNPARLGKLLGERVIDLAVGFEHSHGHSLSLAVIGSLSKETILQIQEHSVSY